MPRTSNGDDDDSSRMPLLEDVPGDEHLVNLRKVKERIRKLQGAGLSSKAAFVHEFMLP